MSDPSLEGASLAESLSIANMTRKLYQDPKARKLLLQSIKSVQPDADIPELQTDAAVEKIHDETLAEVTKLRDELTNERAQAKLDALRRVPVEKHLIDASQMDALDAFMTENGYAVTQYEQAARHFSLANQVAAPREAPPKPREIVDEKALWRNPQAWAKARAYEALEDIRKKA